jgi:hypothetical protein
MNAIENKAAELRSQLGGTIFVFPIDEQDPFSKYAVVVYAGGMYHTYPETENISVAAVGVQTILEQFKKHGEDVSFEKDVRFVSFEAQVNGPDLTMRRLRKENISKPVFQKDVDFTEGDEGATELISARGLLKFSYLQMVEDKNHKAFLFMNEYYKLLAMRKYGKTAAAIRQEVKRMSKDQAIRWIERTYKSYVHDDVEIMDIFQRTV